MLDDNEYDEWLERNYRQQMKVAVVTLIILVVCVTTLLLILGYMLGRAS